MGSADHGVSANSCDWVGVRQSTALLGGTGPERAFVSLGNVRTILKTTLFGVTGFGAMAQRGSAG